MDQTNKLLYLFEEIKTKVEYLENALDEINQVKKSLKVTSADVKAHIRDTISRHLEALRNREIWLLSQVELVQHGKEDILTQKQAELLQLVGGMKKVCSLLEQSTEAEKLGEFVVFEDQLSDLITSVENMNVGPDETPNIFFSGYNFELLESIRGFGRVDCDCAIEGSHITSMMKNLEVSHEPSSNKRKFISSGGPLEDWLLHGQRCSKYKDESSTVSIEKWLTKCKSYSGCDLESEMGYSQKSNSNEWVLLHGKCPEPRDKDLVLGYFDEVKRSSHADWIKPSPKAPEIPKTLVASDTYSKIASLGNENWLLYKQEKSKLKSLPEDLGKIHCNESTNAQWLRKTIQVNTLPKTATGQAFASLANSNNQQWLRSRRPALKCSEQKDCSNCDEWLLNATPSVLSKNDDAESMSDVDWLKVKDVEVVSIENLDLMFSSCRKMNEPTALDVKQSDKSGIKKYNSMLQAQSNKEWLQSSAPSEKEMEIRQQSNVLKVFTELRALSDYKQWLVQPSGLPSDVCKWLTRSSQERCKNCPNTNTCSKDLFSLFDQVKGTDNEPWLKNSTQVLPAEK